MLIKLLFFYASGQTCLAWHAALNLCNCSRIWRTWISRMTASSWIASHRAERRSRQGANQTANLSLCMIQGITTDQIGKACAWVSILAPPTRLSNQNQFKYCSISTTKQQLQSSRQLFELHPHHLSTWRLTPKQFALKGRTHSHNYNSNTLPQLESNSQILHPITCLPS